MIDYRREIIFVENPKCGCHSFRHALYQDSHHHKILSTAHKTAGEIACGYPEEWKQFFKFCVVRDPVEHKHSAYFEFRKDQYRHKGIVSETPEDWARRGFLAPVCLNQTEYAVCADLIINLEHLDYDVRVLNKRAGLNLKILKKNVNTSRPQVSDEFRRLVKGAFPEEFYLFGYND